MRSSPRFLTTPLLRYGIGYGSLLLLSLAISLGGSLATVLSGCGERRGGGARGAVVLGTPRVAAGAGGMGEEMLRIGLRDGDLYQPRGIEVLDDGSAVVVDRSGRIQRFALDGEVLQSWRLPEWSAGQPVDLVQTPWQTILVADTHYSRVLEFSQDGKELRRFRAPKELDLVRGIAVGVGHRIYVAQYGLEGRDQVNVFDRQGNYLKSFGSRGEGPGQFLRPEGVAIDDQGHVYVVDCGNHRIVVFDAEGVFLSSFGGEGEQPGEFLFPFDIECCSDQTLFVVDFRGNRVQHFALSGDYLGGVGTAGREPGEFATPRGVASWVHEDDLWVYVADTSNHRIQRIRWEYDL